VHFGELDVSPRDVVEIRDENSTLLCTLSSCTSISPWLDKDEIYVYKVRKPTYYGTYMYIACKIDKYQYRKINRTAINVTANGTKHMSVQFTPDGGNHIIRTVIDPDDKIGEIIESNNEVNKTIYVEPCRDPAVVDITFSNDLPDPGTAVNITANVTNNGNMTTTFTVDLYATKYEYRPCASRHPPGHPIQSDYYEEIFEKEINTYPEANWTGVHFTKISTIDGTGRTHLQVFDRNDKMSEDHYGRPEVEDVWTWVSGDVLKIKTKLFCNYWTSIWGFDIDTVAHIVTLNQTTVTLEPGETASVTGILPNVRIGNRSIEYTITAVVDQDNIVFETNELNNVVSHELVARCPDLRVDFNPPDKAVIRNTGTRVAEDVEVRMWHDVIDSRQERSGMEFPPKTAKLGDDEPVAIRIHFKKLKFDQGKVWIKNQTQKRVHTIYPGNYPDTWVEVEGEKCSIGYGSIDVEIDRYEYAYDIKVEGDVPANNRKTITIPWTEYEAPYNLTIDADPSNDIIESNEDNNNKTIRMGPDITLKRHTIPDYLQVNKPLNFIVRIENGGTMSVPPFNVTMYAKPDNGTMIPVENYIIKELEPNEDCHVKFIWKPQIDGKYRFIIRVDPEDGIVELDEDNNDLILYGMQIFRYLGYGGSYLETYDKDEVNGGFIFKIGDRDGEGDPKQWYQGNFQKDHIYKAKWNVSLPADANIKIARLYLYWSFTNEYTQPTEFNVKFNEYSLTQDPGYPQYSDYPIEEGIEEFFNYASGVYCYDVKDYITGSNEATVKIRNLHGASSTCIAGMGLVIIYESDSGVLTKYWINEGADLLGCGRFSSLEPDDCTTEVVFNGDIDFDRLNNASLTTVVPFGSSGNEMVDNKFLGDTEWADKKRNGLYLNGKELKDGAWICDYNKDSVGIDKRDVADHLLKSDNIVGIQDRGDNTMTSANAFLVLRYPPDLAVTDIDAPISAVVGKRYAINTTISNEGRSNATDFNVTFYSNGKKLGRQKVSRLDSGDNRTLQFNWKPMYMGKIYSLKVVADELSGPDWVELDFDNNVMTKNVPIVEAGFGNESGPMGAGGEGIGGDGKGSGTSLLDAITGYLMKGTILGGEESGGGGGRGEYSLLGWIMKFSVLTAGILIVCTSYMIEREKYKKRK
jgi:subtilase family serine protease